jgi:hypothetical protein
MGFLIDFVRSNQNEGKRSIPRPRKDRHSHTRSTQLLPQQKGNISIELGKKSDCDSQEMMECKSTQILAESPFNSPMVRKVVHEQVVDKSFVLGAEAGDLAAMLECQAFAIEDLLKSHVDVDKLVFAGTAITTSVKVAANLME